ncbi:putative phospholipase [Cladobotryum mycophilum]|uniref:Phospholipase n=1 Tax=Cladobotryum mycophilum TaxID=491253 RepID=A0ABR0S969_9HYPO
MAFTEHTLGPACRLTPVPRIYNDDGMPPIEAQFFYSSIMSLDDPLLTGSATVASDPKSTKAQLRPFSHGDNNELEKAWLSLISDDDRYQHDGSRNGRSPSLVSADVYTKRRQRLVQFLALKHWEKHRNNPVSREFPLATSETPPASDTLPLCCPGLTFDVSQELQRTFCALARTTNATLDVNAVAQDVVAVLDRHRKFAGDWGGSQPDSLRRPSLTRARDDLVVSSPTTPSFIKKPFANSVDEVIKNSHSRHVSVDYQVRDNVDTVSTTPISRVGTPISIRGRSRALAADDGLTGKPFVRVGSVEPPLQVGSASLPRSDTPILRKLQLDTINPKDAVPDVSPESSVPMNAPTQVFEGKESVEVVVGLARLHMVSLPKLHMKPIYWSPVNDMATVTRATWFYRDSMTPVPPAVANQLEAGYHELRPWTETWSDELRCAIDVGALGEEKVSHRLWPTNVDQKKPGMTKYFISSDPFCSARCFQGDAAAEGSVEPLQTKNEAGAEPTHRPYSSYHVIYKDEASAFLLKPSLMPSAHYGRRPIVKIMKGLTIGIPVVRGFDRFAWEKIHNTKQASAKAEISAQSEFYDESGQEICNACKADKDRGQVTDLVLVAHGIGQKIAERVESYHFTHAINGFRRAVNVELGSPVVRQVLRNGYNGLMILPLNWRLGLSFNDSRPQQEEDKTDDGNATEPFGLKDIEPDTIPAVRSMISDVMFDIPFYMSHHKGKMIKALVSEANRVYRLWCRNNPGFSDKGRVHLIAHSLGSAMAIEILSRQPTIAPPIDLARPDPETRFLEFDTKNLFLMGSPAAFFLLLERGHLTPRRGRRKPGVDVSDTVADDVVGEAGMFGCLAVDNIYNILAKEDPIAYLLNGAVDAAYAASLKTAYVPSASVSFLKSVGDAMRNVMPGMSAGTDPLMLEPERPSAVRLPSQLELEIHDFTREELAEKKAYLLNDNGQIDWFLRSGGGPLEIQYLNMLSAHTSYWTNMDFIRMLCIEIGRKPGRTNTIPAMRAVKASKRNLPTAK